MNISYLFTRLFVCSIVLLFVNACKKSDVPDNNEYVVKEKYIDGVLNNSYEYNDSWQVTKSVHKYQSGPRSWADEKATFLYNSNGHLQQKESLYSYSFPQDIRSEYTYDNQNRLILVTTYKLSTGDLYYKDEYTYNGQTITQTRTSAAAGTGYVATFTLDGNGNIVKSVTDYTSPTMDYTEEWGDYDDKKNIEGRPIVGNVISKNNPRTYTRKFSGSPATKVFYNYTYNKAGYITQYKANNENSTYIHVVKYVLTPKK